MTKTPGSEDPELRSLLDSIGMRTTNTPQPPGQEALDRARAEQDLESITSAASATGPGERAAHGIRRWWRRGAVGLVLAAAIAVLCYALVPSSTAPASAQTPPMLLFSGTEKTTAGGLEGSPAAQVLARLATRAGRQPAPAALPLQRIEQYAWWAETDSDDRNATQSALVPVQRTTYLLPSGTLRDEQHRGDPLDRQGEITDDGSWRGASRTSDETFDTGQPANYPETLPTDPSKLLRALAPLPDCAGKRGDCLLNAVANIFTTYVVAPEASRALWRAAAGLPDVETLGTTTDRLGRHVVALTAPAPKTGQQVVVLVDPDTGAFRGSESILVAANDDFAFSPPAVVAFTAVLDARRVATRTS